MQSLSAAKWSYVTRRVTDTGDVVLGDSIRPPALGDFVIAKIEHIGAHEYLENPDGRRARIYPGDIIVGAWGNRYATDFYEGYLPGPSDPVHLLTSGGLIGTVASAHTSKVGPTELKVIGPLVNAAGEAMNTDDVAMVPSAPGRPELGTIVVVGSSMNAGKTTTTSSIVRGLSKAGLRVGAAKVTGSGSGNDHWDYVDAGADTVVDFIDFGMPSTFGYPVERLVSTMFAIRDQLVDDGADAVVMEIADGVLQDETRALVRQLPGFADEVVLCVGDALGAVAGIQALAGLGVTVRAVSGVVTASPLATREAAAATRLPVLGPVELADGGAAVDLLAEAARRSNMPLETLANLDGTAA